MQKILVTLSNYTLQDFSTHILPAPRPLSIQLLNKTSEKCQFKYLFLAGVSYFH